MFPPFLLFLALAAAQAPPTPPPVLTDVLAPGDLVLHSSRSAQSAALRAATGSRWTHVGLSQDEGDMSNWLTQDLLNGWDAFPDCETDRCDYENSPYGVNIWDYVYNSAVGTSDDLQVLGTECLAGQVP